MVLYNRKNIIFHSAKEKISNLLFIRPIEIVLEEIAVYKEWYVRIHDQKQRSLRNAQIM